MSLREFRIAAAQIASVRGDLPGNIGRHAAAIHSAADHQVSVLIFPELSLTGYEPDLAARLQIQPSDERLAPISGAARQYGMYVVVGAPVASSQDKPHLGAIIFGPDQTVQSYAKMILGGDEPSYFAPGDKLFTFGVLGQTIGLSICADSAEPSHPAKCAELGASVYAAGVFLNAEWYATDAPRFPLHASRFRMLVLMANQGASIGTRTSVGNSAVWGPDGSLLAQADGTPDVLVVATRTGPAWTGQVVPV